MDRNLALEFVRVTEAAAIAAAKWMGRGDKHKADQAAVEEMRSRFNQIDFCGTIVIGEGSKDKAPELYTGEKVGKGSHPLSISPSGRGRGLIMDLAVDPLECTDSVAFGRYNALSVIAAGPKDTLLHAPDTYMNKLAVGKEAAKAIDLEAPVKVNLAKIAQALGKDIQEVSVMMLDRERHQKLLEEIRRAGARVRLITDGDVAAAIATCILDNPVDVLMGIGGSTEAVLAAVAVKILGGEILCQFRPRNDQDLAEIKKAGIKNVKTIFSAEDLAKGQKLTFTATGVIEGPFLQGVIFEKDKIITHSVVMRGSSGTIRYITTHHHISINS